MSHAPDPSDGRDAVKAGPTDTPASGNPALVRPGSAFAHASEAEMARILDFYEVRWEYEPHTFPILWNLDGDVVESFSPDFYLPDADLYLELTTLKQRLVRKKNRKLRRLRELYPDLRIKLFYARDFRALMLKYGKLALADALSGTPGQVMPERDREEVVDAPAPSPSPPVDPPPVPPIARRRPVAPVAPSATAAAPTVVPSTPAATPMTPAATTRAERRRAREARR